MLFNGFQTARQQLKDIEISYVTAGSGPPVLLLHGYPQTKEMWAHVAPILAQEYKVICADLRGYGASSRPMESADYANYSFRAMAQDQVELMAALGFDEFHLIGHDRGGRVGHRLALDHPERLLSLTLMDIVPTHSMFRKTSDEISGAYWHWYFLSQPSPFPERMIGNDPDFFFETCLVGWGASRLEDFDQEQLAAYRTAWRDPLMIHGSCADYRAAAHVDLKLDDEDISRRVTCPVLVFYGADGAMARLFDIPAEWRERCSDVKEASLPGGHFFVDQYPHETADILRSFLARQG